MWEQVRRRRWGEAKNELWIPHDVTLSTCYDLNLASILLKERMLGHETTCWSLVEGFLRLQ